MLQVVRISFFFLSILLSHLSFSQDRCGTNAHTQMLREKNFLRETKDGFEQWMQQKLRSANQPLQTQSTQTGPYQVPVVVHVIHNGEAIGTGVNISDAQILSQIDVLNADFKRLNADASNTPAEFLPVAGAFDIEFVMAKQSPEGLSTNGIVRVQGTQTQWTIADNYTLKAQSYWPAEDYLNIWVTNMGGGLIGYAQFPVSPLPGLESASNNRLTDGVVIHYRAFGSIDDGAFDLDSRYNKGRTTTHEVGHFFGLRHLSGDDNSCSSTDYVDDTPVQNGNTTGCPSHPQLECSSNNMFQNYLDYTNDVCMNLFTQGQVARMQVVIESSPRRLSLLTSPGLTTAPAVANDLGIRNIISPSTSECSSLIAPQIEIVNYGNNTVTSTRITIKKNGTPVETIDYVVNLIPLSSAILTFSNQNFGSDFIFEAEILLTNGLTDGNLADNVMTQAVTIPPSIAIPFYEPFLSTPANWKVTNPDQSYTWANATAPKDAPANKAMKMNFFDYKDSYGEVDIFASPVFDLSSAPVAIFTFDVAHAQFKNTLSNDELKVVVLRDCSVDYLTADIVYNKEGAALATVDPLNTPFTPTGENDWRREVIDLSDYLGQSNVQIAFIGINDWGNNLYIDNATVITSAVEDLSIVQVVSPGPVTCNENPAPMLEVQNMGSTVITSFKVHYGIDGANPVITLFTGLNLLPGDKIEIEVPSQQVSFGEHQLSFKLKEPNGLVDINPANSELDYTVILDGSADRIPLRENFDAGFVGWSVVNPSAGEPWKTSLTNYSVSMFYNGYENTTLNDQAWLVSPVLDFSSSNQASLFFDKSYAYRANTNDQLQILASTDCGKQYDILLLNQSGRSLSPNTAETFWTPAMPSDWTKEYLNLNTLAGEKDVRIAFVFTNDNGNNLYIDNIEFYISDDPTPPETSNPYVVYMTKDGEFGDFNITFNLENRQDVQLEVVSMLGTRVYSQLLSDVLNQTYSIDLTDGATGIYIIRLHMNDGYFASKVYVTK